MKRAVRWIGLGITAAAAATMLLADVALAAPRGGSGPMRGAETTYGTIVHRPGDAATMTIVDLGDRTEYQHKTWVRLD